MVLEFQGHNEEILRVETLQNDLEEQRQGEYKKWLHPSSAIDCPSLICTGDLEKDLSDFGLENCEGRSSLCQRK
jgi:hypothetical protein